MKVLIAAAGSGKRAGLPYPKTLYPVQGQPILLRLLRLLHEVDERPTVIVSPSGRTPIAEAIEAEGLQADLIVQNAPTGMGDAVLQFRAAPAFKETEHLLTVWGDIPFIQPETVRAVVETHLAHGNDFTFATRHVEEAYTIVSRDEAGAVRALEETRELGVPPARGERDIGLFAFRVKPTLDLLDQRLPGALGKATGEHGFLYIVRHLAERGHKVEALPVATELDLVSLNRLSDLDGVAGAAARP
jgi:bifunctional UDP-N-acetylglucosamine pyrophosphorylase/glucosamine-1-phosphate N-acetyltransferase